MNGSSQTSAATFFLFSIVLFGPLNCIPVRGLSCNDSLATGASHTCAITWEGKIECWGQNRYGQANTPGALYGITGKVHSLTSGSHHNCVLDVNNTVSCWGFNSYRRTDVPFGLGAVLSVTASYTHTCAVKQDGFVYCWGGNAFYQSDVPANLGKVKALTVAPLYNCALKENGAVSCWGFNSNGQKIWSAGLASMKQTHACAMDAHRNVSCKSSYAKVPTNLSKVLSVTHGSSHTCAVREDYTVACWGNDNSSQASPPVGLRVCGWVCTTDPDCQTCSSSRCSLCGNSKYLLNVACVAECPMGYFGMGTGSTSRTCQNCTADCNTCPSKSICTTCGNSKYLSNNTCIAACPSGYAAVGNATTNRTCQTCEANCTKCSSTSTCVKCSNSTYLSNGNCVTACPARHVAIGTGATGRVCQACEGNCSTCSSASRCTACSNSMYLNSDDCIAACPYGSVGLGTGQQGRFCRVVCETDCRTCVSSTTCTGCNASKYLVNGDCATACSSGYFGTGTGTMDRSCQACGPHCKTCASLRACAVCGNARYLSNTACVSVCPGGYFQTGAGATNRTCQACGSDCDKCSSNTKCTHCGNSKYLNNDDCVATCPSGYVGIGTSARGRACQAEPEEDESPSIVIVVALVIGGLVVIAFVAVGIFCGMRCTRPEKHKDGKDETVDEVTWVQPIRDEENIAATSDPWNSSNISPQAEVLNMQFKGAWDAPGNPADTAPWASSLKTKIQASRDRSPRGWKPDAVSPRPSPRWNIHGAPPAINASPRGVPTMLVPDVPPRSKEMMNSPRGIVQPAWSAQLSPRPSPGGAMRSPRNDFRDVSKGATPGLRVAPLTMPGQSPRGRRQ